MKLRRQLGGSVPRPKDTRPYVRDVGGWSQGRVNRAAATSGMVLVAVAMGFVIGVAVLLAMRLSGWLTELIWGGYLHEGVRLAGYPLAVCTVGGLCIGLWTRFSGDRVRSLHDVMAEFRSTGSYHVHPAKGVVSFLLPLVFGGSIGFEAGIAGLITSACCWIRDRLKAAGLRVGEVTQASVAASLSAIFGAPFAGIVAGATGLPRDESSDVADPADYNMRRGVKLVLYTAAAFGALAGAKGLSAVLGTTSGMPRFGGIGAQGAGYLWAILAIAVAYALTCVYFVSRQFFSRVSRRMGEGTAATVLKPVVAGAIMGAVACALPYVLFPGEDQSYAVMDGWTTWPAIVLLGTGVLKAAVTPMCLQMGWSGGHFFPIIFAGVVAGYGLAALTGADPMLMVTVTSTALLAGVVRAPLMTAALMLLVFPAENVIWMGLAAVVGYALPLPAPILGGEEREHE